MFNPDGLNKLLPALFVLTLIVFTLGSSNASATDDKVISGANCQSYNPSSASLLYHFFNSVYVPGPTSRTVLVTCPLLRDNTTNSSGTYRVDVRVYRASGPSSSSVSCTLYSNGTHGSIVQSNSRSFSGVGNGTISLDVNRSVARGSYVVTCRLPTYASLYNIVLREH